MPFTRFRDPNPACWRCTYRKLRIDFSQCIARHAVRDLEVAVRFGGEGSLDVGFGARWTSGGKSDQAEKNCCGREIHGGIRLVGGRDYRGPENFWDG